MNIFLHFKYVHTKYNNLFLLMVIKIMVFLINNDIFYIICQSLDGDFFMIFSCNTAFVYIF